MRVAYVGNFRPEHSTENHVRAALTRGLGHQVITYQEDEMTGRTWRQLAAEPDVFDLLLWTRTWPVDADAARLCLARFDSHSVPTVAFHLDRWFGLHREHEITGRDRHPMFDCSIVCTADGGHPDEFERAGIDHVWTPPAVDEWEAQPGFPTRQFTSPVAFVGSWQGGYHPEWPHRDELVAVLQERYGPRCRFWPARRGPSLRGRALRDLYASATVLVGDSCLAGGATRYWSDRIPETIGRRGFLVHPNVVGLEEHFAPGVHLATWDLGDWPDLVEIVDYYVDNPDDARAIADAGRAHVLQHHTYTVRMRQVLAAAGVQ